MEYDELTTTALIDIVRADPRAGPRELILLDRLCTALEELDLLTNELARERATA